MKDLRAELRVVQMMRPEGLTFRDELLNKLVDSWGKEEDTYLMYKSEVVK